MNAVTGAWLAMCQWFGPLTYPSSTRNGNLGTRGDGIAANLELIYLALDDDFFLSRYLKFRSTALTSSLTPSSPSRTGLLVNL